MKKPIVFTLITVTYNAEQTLGRTLQSVAEQTYPHIEHILIDGASKDNTLQITREQGKHLAHIVSEPDKGLYDAMNKGLRLACGDYICFLNAGDKLHNAHTLKQISEELNDYNKETELPGVLYGHTDIVDAEGNFLHARRLSPPEQLTWKSFRNGMLVCHQAFYARRELCVPYDTSFRFSADFDWCIRVMKQTQKFHHLRFTLVDYLQEGLTTQNHHASLLERFRIMRNHYGIISTLFFHMWFIIRTTFSYIGSTVSSTTKTKR